MHFDICFPRYHTGGQEPDSEEHSRILIFPRVTRHKQAASPASYTRWYRHWQQSVLLLFVCCLQIYKTTHSTVMAWFLVQETLTSITNALRGWSVILMCLNWYRYSWSAVRPHMCRHSLDRLVLVKKPSGLWSKTCFLFFSFHISHPLSLVNHYRLININLTICVAQTPRLCQKC